MHWPLSTVYFIMRIVFHTFCPNVVSYLYLLCILIHLLFIFIHVLFIFIHVLSIFIHFFQSNFQAENYLWPLRIVAQFFSKSEITTKNVWRVSSAISYFFKNGPSQASFPFIFVFSNKQYNFDKK